MHNVVSNMTVTETGMDKSKEKLDTKDEEIAEKISSKEEQSTKEQKIEDDEEPEDNK